MQITSGGAPPEYTVNTSVVLVLFGYSKGARKVSAKCIKGTPAVLRGYLQGTRLSITAPDYFLGLPPVDKRNFWLTCTCLNQPCPVLSWHDWNSRISVVTAMLLISVKAKLPWIQLLIETAWRTVLNVSEWTLVQTHKLPVSLYKQFALTSLH